MNTRLSLNLHESVRLQMRLKEAIEKSLLELHYQPQVGVESGLIVGVEALLRWNDPLLGQDSPKRFISIAESTGLILPLSEWVLQTACEQIASWCRVGTPLRVAVNMSAKQFHQWDFPDQVGVALARAGAQAEYLDIEITESVAIANLHLVHKHITALTRMGCRVALDDFGTGYSSLGYLKALPVSKLKIDKTIIDGIPRKSCDVTISKSIINLAHSLGMTIVAEGVETEKQLEFLYQNECEIYQGWLYSKALAAKELNAKLMFWNADSHI
jgi:EAL domain-containing protein (putative c-di-GMP-specific phosphodiesterase class I)